MARSHLRHTVKDQRGNVLEGATVNLYETGTTTAVDDAYDALTGGSLVTSLLSDASGEVEAWFDDARTVDLEISSTLGVTKIAATGSLVSFTTLTESVALVSAGADAPTYTPTNVTTSRSFDADTVTLPELADIVGTMIADIQAEGTFQ